MPATCHCDRKLGRPLPDLVIFFLEKFKEESYGRLIVHCVIHLQRRLVFGPPPCWAMFSPLLSGPQEPVPTIVLAD